jgi:hypothetical protein
LIPADLVNVFDERELELLIGGIADIDVDDWKKHTDYRGYQEQDEVIQNFWKVIRSWDAEQKSRLLQFATGTSRIPVNGFKDLQGSDGPRRFTIEKAGEVNALPKSHTWYVLCADCLFWDHSLTKSQLQPPGSSTLQDVRSAEWQAFHSCRGNIGLRTGIVRGFASLGYSLSGSQEISHAAKQGCGVAEDRRTACFTLSEVYGRSEVQPVGQRNLCCAGEERTDFVNMHRVNLDELGTLYKDFLGSDLTPVSMRRVVILGEGARQEGAGLAAYRSRARQAGTDDGVFVLQPLKTIIKRSHVHPQGSAIYCSAWP